MVEQTSASGVGKADEPGRRYTLPIKPLRLRPHLMNSRLLNKPFLETAANLPEGLVRFRRLTPDGA